jgi:putative peptide zinc metalloprotease protein
MTLQLRPTFSESWYRVKDLRAKLRASAQISRQFYRGERWYVVRDPAGNQYHRLSDPAYRFVALLDGTRTVSEAWDVCGGMLDDDAPTQPEVIQILSHLYSANLIDADVTPDATVLLRRHKQLSKRKMQNRLMNVLFPRIPLWDPDRFLQRWMPLARILFSKFGALVWLVVVGAAIFMLAPFWGRGDHSLQHAAKHAVDLKYNTINIFYLWAVFCFVKLIHELGHAFACRRFGGECHELGIMFLVFVPTPYVDASSAWSFSNKWQRIFVGAAGMIVELFFASLAAFVWITAGNPNSLIAQLAFNAMLVASVTTILFNANPLLRYDGYYILSDFLEIPNLRQKSTEYTMGLFKRHIFRVKLQQPLPPLLQRFWLFLYSVASSIYRVFIGVIIILMVAFQIPILGMLMAIGGVATWLLVPIYTVFKYLALDPELHRKRTGAVAFTLALTALLLVGIGLVPFPLNIDQEGVADAAQHQVVMPKWPAFVSEIRAHDGDSLKAGDVILVTTDDDLDRKVAEAQADVLYDELKQKSDRVSSPEQLRGDEALLQAHGNILRELTQQRELLTIRSPISGKLIAPDLKDMVGRHLERGTQVGTVQDAKYLTVKILLEQNNSGLVTRLLKNKATEKAGIKPAQELKTEIRLASDIGNVLDGGTPFPVSAGSQKPPGEAVLQAAGGEQPSDPRDPKKLQSDEFEVDVPVTNPPDKNYVTGQKAYVQFKLGKEPLMYRWYRRVLQVLQSRPSSPLV